MEKKGKERKERKGKKRKERKMKYYLRTCGFTIPFAFSIWVAQMFARALCSKERGVRCTITKWIDSVARHICCVRCVLQGVNILDPIHFGFFCSAALTAYSIAHLSARLALLTATPNTVPFNDLDVGARHHKEEDKRPHAPPPSASQMVDAVLYRIFFQLHILCHRVYSNTCSCSRACLRS